MIRQPYVRAGFFFDLFFVPAAGAATLSMPSNSGSVGWGGHPPGFLGGASASMSSNARSPLRISPNF